MAIEKEKEKIRKILAMLEGATSEGEARAASLALHRGEPRGGGELLGRVQEAQRPVPLFPRSQHIPRRLRPGPCGRIRRAANENRRDGPRFARPAPGSRCRRGDEPADGEVPLRLGGIGCQSGRRSRRLRLRQGRSDRLLACRGAGAAPRDGCVAESFASDWKPSPSELVCIEKKRIRRHSLRPRGSGAFPLLEIGLASRFAKGAERCSACLELMACGCLSVFFDISVSVRLLQWVFFNVRVLFFAAPLCLRAERARKRAQAHDAVRGGETTAYRCDSNRTESLSAAGLFALRPSGPPAPRWTPEGNRRQRRAAPFSGARDPMPAAWDGTSLRPFFEWANCCEQPPAEGQSETALAMPLIRPNLCDRETRAASRACPAVGAAAGGPEIFQKFRAPPGRGGAGVRRARLFSRDV